MYLRIKNFKKILEAPHPLYTCIGCNEKENTYVIDIAGDNDNQIYTIYIDRTQDKLCLGQDKNNSDNEYSFRVEGKNVQNGFDWGYLKVEDLQSRTILFKLLCHSIEEIKIIK